MKKIKIAQIGTSKNGHGNAVFQTLVENPDIFEIVGYTLPENEREKFPKCMPLFEGYREMTLEEILNDPAIEAVTVETEEIYLTKYALLSAKAGKHIHMEKPGGLSLSDFEELTATAKKNGTVFHVGYMYRYNPVIQSTLARVRAGEFGEIISVEAQMSGYRGIDMTEWLRTFTGGMMFYLGCHLVDLVYAIQGAPQRVLPFNKASHTHATEGKDNCFALFEYENGVSFVKTSQAERGGYARRQIVITGTKGSIEIKPLEVDIGYPVLRTDYTECFSEKFTVLPERCESAPYHRYQAMMRAFAAMVGEGKQNPYTYDYELEMFKLLLQACGEEV